MSDDWVRHGEFRRITNWVGSTGRPKGRRRHALPQHFVEVTASFRHSGGHADTTLLEEINKFPVTAPSEDGSSVTVWLTLEDQYSYDDVKYVSMDTITEALVADSSYMHTEPDPDAGEGMLEVSGFVDDGMHPTRIRNRRDKLMNYGNVLTEVAKWLGHHGEGYTFNWNNSECIIIAGSGNDRDGLEACSTEDWIDPNATGNVPSSGKQDYTLGQISSVFKPRATSTNNDCDGEILNGLPGDDDPEWRDFWRWGTRGGRTISSLGLTDSFNRARTLSSHPRYLPYSSEGQVGEGVRQSVAQYGAQLCEDYDFLYNRMRRINDTLYAFWRNANATTTNEQGEEVPDAEVRRESDAHMAQLAELQQLRNRQAAGEALSADELARLQALERNLSTDEDNRAVAELISGSGAEFASEFRSKEQCFLMKNMLALAQANITRQVVYSTDTQGPKAYAIQGTPGQVVSALTYDPAYAAYYLLTPDKLSYLVPSVRFYSVLHQYAKPNPNGPGTIQEDLTQPVDFEVPFFQHIHDHAIEQIMSGRFGGKGGQVGMKSFDWSYQGSNPATSRRDIKATLTMHAQSFDDLVKTHSVPLYDSQGTEFTHNWAYTDLAIRRNRDHMQSPDVLYQQLKVVAGWSLPDATSETINFTEQEVQAIKNSRVTMYLTIIDHAFDINEDGTVEFKIEYRAYIEGAFTSPEANVLISDASIASESDRQEAMALMRADLTSHSGSCTEDDLAELRRRISNSIQMDKQNAHVALIQGLEINKPESRIFMYSVSAAQMMRFIRSPGLDGTDAQWDQMTNEGNLGITGSVGSGQTGVAEQLAREINFPSTIDFNNSENSPDVQEMLETVYAAPVLGEVHINYFFLGDLINVALENINKVDSSQAARTSTPRKFEKMRLLMGPLEFTDPFDNTKRMQLNLADIPISVNYFMEWFLERITAKSETKWFIIDFIKDIVKNLVLKILSDEDCFNGAFRQRANFQNLYLVGAEKQGMDPIGGLIQSTSADPNSPTNQTKRLFVEEFMGPNSTNIPILQQDTQDVAQPTQGMYHNVLIYASDPTPRNLRGNWVEDTAKGVFHFHIGTNKGIVKRIKFEKTDQPYLREARYFGQGYTGMSQLREPYKITIDMFGNSKVFPGQTIFVDPSGLGYGLGRPNEEDSPAHLLGLGGYHMIINVDHVIEAGKFETIAKATWVFRGSPSGEITDRADPSTPTRASAECQAFGELTQPSGYVPPADPPSEGGEP